MSLLKTRDHYKPFDYPWMYDYYKLQNQMHWMPESVPLKTGKMYQKKKDIY